jgi:hypothetical protein
LITGAASGTIVSGRADMVAPSAMRAFNGASTITGGSPGVPIRPLGGIQFAAALAGGYNAAPQYDQVDGLIIVPPGALLAICTGNGIGTSWVVNIAMGWAEVDWPN